MSPGENVPVKKLHFFERVSSTMDVLHELAAAGAEAGTAVLAGEQLQGRGSRGRTWHSPPGGLWLSVLFRPIVVDGLEVMSLRAGLALVQAIQPLVPETLQLKWPNDVMLGTRKLGGVLCEARWQGDALGWVVVGVGMNVRNPIADELHSTAVGLSRLVPDITVDHVCAPLLAALSNLDLGARLLSPEELRQFASRDWLCGRSIREPVAGIVQGLAADGRLMVRTLSGAHVSLRSGTVELDAPLTAGNFDHASGIGHRQH